MNRDFLRELWQQHNGKILGTAFGFFLAVFILLFGFFQTIFILFCMIGGFVIGKRIDEKEDLADIFERLLPPYHR